MTGPSADGPSSAVASSGSPGESPLPRLERTVSELRGAVHELRRAVGGRIGFVPTMGALHEGHLSLVDRAREVSDGVVVSIFVNPAQFGPDEDFDAYPRDLAGDRKRAGERGVDLLFAPPASEMYPVEQTIWVEPGPLADRLCGRYRPGHFRGVLTVVLKLLNVVGPDVAVFGRKDFQQAVLIRRMVRELHLPTAIETAPIVREEDGLAMSSRNAYLSDSERVAARSLSEALREVRALYRRGERDPHVLRETARSLVVEAGAEPEYVVLVDPRDLERVELAGDDAVCAIAAHVGETRLIDNAPLAGPCSL